MNNPLSHKRKLQRIKGNINYSGVLAIYCTAATPNKKPLFYHLNKFLKIQNRQQYETKILKVQQPGCHLK